MLNNKLLIILLSAIIPLNFSAKLYSMSNTVRSVVNKQAQAKNQRDIIISLTKRIILFKILFGRRTNNNSSKEIFSVVKTQDNNKKKYLLGAFTLGVSAFGLKQLYNYYKNRTRLNNVIAEDIEEDVNLTNFKNHLSDLTSSLTHDQWAQYQNIHNVINQALEGNFTLIQEPLFFSILNDEQQHLVTEAIKAYKLNII